MSNLVSVIPWQSKPWPGVSVDYTNPLAHGIAGCWVLNEGSGTTIYNAANPAVNAGTFVNSPTWTSGANGPGVTMVSASTQYIDCGVMPNVSGSQATILIVGRRAATKVMCAGIAGNINNELFLVWYSDNSLYLIARTANQLAAKTNPLALAGDYAIAGVFNGTTTPIGQIYLNGVSQALISQGSSTSLPAFASSFMIGRNEASSYYSDARFDLVTIWTRALSTQEVSAVSANPWQMFQPRKLFGSGAGGTTHQGQASLTASSSLAAIASVAHVARATLAAVSTITPSRASVAHGATASLAASSSTTGRGAVAHKAIAPLAASSALTGRGVVAHKAIAALAASSDMTATASVTKRSLAVLAASSGLSAGASVGHGGKAALAASSTVTATASATKRSLAVLAASSGLSAVASVSRRAGAVLSAGSEVDATATVAVGRPSALAGGVGQSLQVPTEYAYVS